jgi:predicted metal-dependent hydrolase
VDGDGAPEPVLTPEEGEAFARSIALFNAASFHECHDVLEDVWSGVRGPSRDFFQGLIQVAVAFYHLGRGNRRGAASLFRRGLGRLDRYPERYAGVDLGAFRAVVRDWEEAVAAGGALPGNRPAPRLERT